MTSQNQQIVICGAGIAGIAAAYHLAVVHGCRDVVIVEQGDPLSMTSDKSTESYRNWWPGPDAAQTHFMNHSIDLLERLAAQSQNRINLNRRGYLFVSADASKEAWLVEMAELAARHGAGPVRVHSHPGSVYKPSALRGFNTALTGADVITDRALIQRHFPYLSPETRVVAHARRAGWLSAQQLGMMMLEAALEAGVRLCRGRVARIDVVGNCVSAVRVDQVGTELTLPTTHVVLAAGPLLKLLAASIGLELPIFSERHYKISLADTLGVVPRDAPMLIWLDEQRLPWSAEERELLAADQDTRWLTEVFPSGVHGRVDGGSDGKTLLALFNYENIPSEVTFPLPEPDYYAEIAMRGMSTMVPGLGAYVGRAARPYIDGGYYTKTRENRQLIGPTPIDGLLLNGAYSGFGVMASCAGGDLLARHLLQLELPPYANAFELSRYDDADYVAQIETWGDGGQL